MVTVTTIRSPELDEGSAALGVSTGGAAGAGLALPEASVATSTEGAGAGTRSAGSRGVTSGFSGPGDATGAYGGCLIGDSLLERSKNQAPVMTTATTAAIMSTAKRERPDELRWGSFKLALGSAEGARDFGLEVGAAIGIEDWLLAASNASSQLSSS